MISTVGSVKSQTSSQPVLSRYKPANTNKQSAEPHITIEYKYSHPKIDPASILVQNEGSEQVPKAQQRQQKDGKNLKIVLLNENKTV